jgi:hypothetical protein
MGPARAAAPAPQAVATAFALHASACSRVGKSSTERCKNRAGGRFVYRRAKHEGSARLSAECRPPPLGSACHCTG